jgi:integrase
MIKKGMVSLGSIIAQAQQQGQVAHNAVRELHSKRRRGNQKRGERKAKLRVGVDIPTREEIGSMLAHAPERWRPLLLVADFTGLRAGELRGLRWSDVDLKKGVLHVHQRADRWGDMDLPKSSAGERKVPFGKIVANRGAVTASRSRRLKACGSSRAAACSPTKRLIPSPSIRRASSARHQS